MKQFFPRRLQTEKGQEVTRLEHSLRKVLRRLYSGREPAPEPNVTTDTDL